MRGNSMMWGLAALLLAGAGTASAQCNNPKNWLESPKDGVKVLIGYEQELRGFASDTMNGIDTSPFPPPLPADMLDKHGQGQLLVEPVTLATKAKSVVSHYEPDGRGNWRVCRQETWWPRKESTEPWEISSTLANQTGNPILAPLSKTHVMRFVNVFLYDPKGRLTERFLGGSEKNGVSTDSPECFRYDHKDHIVLYVEARESNVCPTGDPDPRDFWRLFRFGDDANGQAISLWAEYHSGKPDGSWSKHIFFRAGPDIRRMSSLAFDALKFAAGNADLDSEKGLFRIQGGVNLGPKDKSAGPTFLYSDGSSKGMTYYFPKPPVPISVLTDIEQLYQYDRRRETVATGGIKLVEYFPANQHQLRDRFFTGGGRVVRQEQFDEQGRLKRVINLGMLGLNKSNGGFYEEDLKSGGISLKLKTNKLYYRVWEYDAAGKAKLVAIGWNRKLGTKLTHEKLDAAPVVYGTPDGKVRWKTKEEFFKAFDFDATARRAYPEFRRAE